MKGDLGRRAVIIGGSVAGLCAAVVLADHVDEVVVVDRDQVVDVEASRPGASHTAHAHGLHGRGYDAMDELFPGLMAELEAQGAPIGDLGQMDWYFGGRRLQKADTGLRSLTLLRPILENALRRRVQALGRVRFLEQTDVDGFLLARDGTRVHAVKLTDRRSGATRELATDVLLDSAGRGSRTPRWLEDAGFGRPVEDRVRIGLTYTSRLYRLGPNLLEHTQSINPVASPALPRGAFLGRVTAEACILSLTGVLGDAAPEDPDGFQAYAETLPIPDVADAVRSAEPLGDPVAFRFPASVRRRYERMPALPDGLLVMGDALCSFNPVYGQGMSVAALEAKALRDHLYSGAEQAAFYRSVAAIIDVPWQMATGGDLAFPGVPGPKPLAVRAMNAYLDRLQRGATVDPSLTEALMRVSGLVDPPTALFRPRVVTSVLRHGGSHRTPPTGAVPAPRSTGALT